MNNLSPVVSQINPAAAEFRSLMLAAEAVLAQRLARAPNRFEQVSLATTPSIHYPLAPDAQAMQSNRGLLEDVVMVALAAEACAELLGAPIEPSSSQQAQALLEAGLSNPEEHAVLDAYLTVLRARAKACLRLWWAEVQVVAAGLREHQTLDAEAIRFRIQCAQSIRTTLMN